MAPGSEDHSKTQLQRRQPAAAGVNPAELERGHSRRRCALLLTRSLTRSTAGRRLPSARVAVPQHSPARARGFPRRGRTLFRPFLLDGLGRTDITHTERCCSTRHQRRGRTAAWWQTPAGTGRGRPWRTAASWRTAARWRIPASSAAGGTTPASVAPAPGR